MSLDPVAEQLDAAKGGVWSDENLVESLDWQGETVGKDAAIDSAKTYTPRTQDEIIDQVLEKSNITSDLVSAITSKVERKILSSKRSGHSSILEMIETALQTEGNKVEQWLDSQQKKIDGIVEKQNSSTAIKQSDIDRLDEKIRVLEERMSVILAEQATGKTEEFAVLHEAAAIIRDRRATEELETESLPSVLDRMEKRTQAVNDQMRRLEPHVREADRVVANRVNRPAQARKKFGRTM